MHGPLTEPDVRVIASGSSVLIPSGDEVHHKDPQETPDLFPGTNRLASLHVLEWKGRFSMRTFAFEAVLLSISLFLTPGVSSSLFSSFAVEYCVAFFLSSHRTHSSVSSHGPIHSSSPILADRGSTSSGSASPRLPSGFAASSPLLAP